MNMELIQLLRTRRSVRKFKQFPVEPEKIEQLVEAAVRTPTSRGRNPWQFVVVTSADVIADISKAKEHGSQFLSGAPLAIVIAADTTVSDVWIEDCSIAAFTVQMVAEELGLGSCWAQIRLRPHDIECSANSYLCELLDFPEHYSVECIIGVGYADEEKEGHPHDTLPFSRVRYLK